MESWIPGFMELRIHGFWGSMIQEPIDPWILQCVDSWIRRLIDPGGLGFMDSALR